MHENTCCYHSTTTGIARMFNTITVVVMLNRDITSRDGAGVPVVAVALVKKNKKFFCAGKKFVFYFWAVALVLYRKKKFKKIPMNYIDSPRVVKFLAPFLPHRGWFCGGNSKLTMPKFGSLDKRTLCSTHTFRFRHRWGPWG